MRAAALTQFANMPERPPIIGASIKFYCQTPLHLKMPDPERLGVLTFVQGGWAFCPGNSKRPPDGPHEWRELESPISVGSLRTRAFGNVRGPTARE